MTWGDDGEDDSDGGEEGTNVATVLNPDQEQRRKELAEKIKSMVNNKGTTRTYTTISPHMNTTTSNNKTPNGGSPYDLLMKFSPSFAQNNMEPPPPRPPSRQNPVEQVVLQPSEEQKKEPEQEAWCRPQKVNLMSLAKQLKSSQPSTPNSPS